MNNSQVLKLLKVAIITTIVLLVFEIIFSIKAVNEFFEGLITNSKGWLVYLIVWVIMFLQVTVLNVPAYVILSACVGIGMQTLSVTYILVVLSAYMSGCILAYWLGRWFGAKAVRWCAGSQDDFDKWCKVINEKGKWWYFTSIVFPVFPDDLLCIVVGSVRFNFWFYCIANLVGRGVGLVTMLLVLEFIGLAESSFPFMIIVWGVALLGETIVYFVIKRRIKT